MRIPTIPTRFPGAAVSLKGLILVLLTLGCVPLFYWSSSPVHAAQAFGFGGNHEVADCARISGWAWNVNQPNTPISVDIYVDDVLTAQVAADQFRQDLLDAGIGNGVHAFTFATPSNLRDGQPHSVRVRFTGTNIDLTNTPRTINCSEFDFHGNHEVADCMRISGWAWDANQPTTPISIDVWLDSDNFASIRAPANQFRQDLLDAGIGDGFHAFNFATPAFLKDGHTHTIRVKFAFTSIDVPGTPRSINCASNPAPVYQGNQDESDCTAIAGWAWDATQPNTPISVDIYSGPVLIAAGVPADQFRQDLLDAGIGNGVHGFRFLVPDSLKDGQPHSIGVGFGGTSIGLPNTPQTITCTLAPYQGNHEVADCTRISGWAWDSSQPNTPINVDIFDGGALIATVPANQFRQDLLDAGIGNGMHAFTFTTPSGLKDGQAHSIRVRFAGVTADLLNTPRTINCPSQ